MKIKTGDKLPSSELFYLNQSNNVKKIDILDLCKNDKVIILGMPGAFTKTCSALHLPGYIKNYDLALKKGVSKIICISVNDPNVMKAWGDANGVEGKVQMLSDHQGEFTRAIGLALDLTEPFGCGERSERYSMIVNDGVVEEINVEKDFLACDVSSVESLIKAA